MIENQRRPWAVIAATGAGVIAVGYGFGRYAYGLFVPQFQETLDLSATDVGTLAGLSTLGYACGLLIAPWTAARSAWATIIAAGSVTSVGLALMGLDGHLLVFGSGVWLAGIGPGLSSPAMAQLISDSVGAQEQSRTQTWTNTGTSIGLGSSAFTPILPFDWRAMWLSFAVVAGLTTCTAAWLLPRNRRATPRPASHAGSELAGSWPARAEIRRLLAASILLGTTSAPYWTFSRAQVLDVGHSTAFSTFFWFTIGAGGLLGGLAGRLADRHGLRQAYTLTWLAWAAALGLLAIPGVPAGAAIGSAAVFGAAYMTLTGLCIVWAAQLYPRIASRGVTMSFLALGVGQTIAAPASGVLADHSSLGTVFGLTAAASLAALSVLPRRTSAASADEMNARTG